MHYVIYETTPVMMKGSGLFIDGFYIDISSFFFLKKLFLIFSDFGNSVK